MESDFRICDGMGSSIPNRTWTNRAKVKTCRFAKSCGEFECKLFLLVAAALVGNLGETLAQPVMTFPSETDAGGTYSLFPDEDLRTGRKIRFQDDRGRQIPPRRSYPIMFEDRIRRPGDFATDRPRDPISNRGSRVYFEDDRTSNYFHKTRMYPDDGRFPPPPSSDNYNNNYYNRPNLLQRPLSPLQSYNYNYTSNNRPYHHHYRPNVPVAPGPSHSKLPVGATLGNLPDSHLRVHVFDPSSKNFGDPRNKHGARSGFVENGGPSPELFLNHEQYLEYHRKIALAREQEFRKHQALGHNSSYVNHTHSSNDSKKLLFEAKQPFVPSNPAAANPSPEVAQQETKGKGQVTIGQVSFVGSKQESPPNDSPTVTEQEAPSELQSGENASNSKNNHHHHHLNNDNFEAADGGRHNSPVLQEIAGIIHQDQNGNVQIESENLKSQVTRVPPQRPSFITKSGRRLAYPQQQQQTHPKASHNNVDHSPAPFESHKIKKPEGQGAEPFHLSSSRQPLTSDENVNSAVNSPSPSGDQAHSQGQLKTTSSTTTATPSKPHVVVSTTTDPNKEIYLPPYTPIQTANADNERNKTSLTTSAPKAKQIKLKTDNAKHRIKANKADKIAIIKHQEIKQKKKLRKEQAFPATDQLTTTKLTPKAERYVQKTKAKVASEAAAAAAQSSTRSVPLGSDDLKALKELHVDGHGQPTPFISTNDLMLPHDHDQKSDEYHFSLINSNNDRVDIISDPARLLDLEQSDTNSTSLLYISPSGRSASSTVSAADTPSGRHCPNNTTTDVDAPHNYDASSRHNGNNSTTSGSANTKFPHSTIPSTSAKNFRSTKVSGSATSSLASSFIKVVRLKNPDPMKTSALHTSFDNSTDVTGWPTAQKTLSMFMAKRQDFSEVKRQKIDAAAQKLRFSSSINATMLAKLKEKLKNKIVKKISTASGSKNGVQSVFRVKAEVVSNNVSIPMGDSLRKNSSSVKLPSRSKAVIAKVHAHVSHCPKLKTPAEIICDIHIRPSHGHPNPQLTVGWRRKFYNSSTPDVLLVSNQTHVHQSQTSSLSNGSRGKSYVSKENDHLVDFHDKFNVTLAPGISPMLRSVLLIRSVTAPDCGNYQCEVTDGVYTLSSETLLFLCH